MTREKQIKKLQILPGVGKSIANDLWNIGIREPGDLKGKDPEDLFRMSNQYVGIVQDRCLLYVYRCAVYFVGTEKDNRDTEKLKWWNWKD
jgi:hypothetical protein